MVHPTKTYAISSQGHETIIRKDRLRPTLLVYTMASPEGKKNPYGWSCLESGMG